MTILHFLINGAGVLLEVFIIAAFFQAASKKAALKKIAYLAAFIGYILIDTVTLLFGFDQILKFMLISSSIFFFSFTYKFTIYKRVVYSFVIIILMVLSEIFVGMILSVIIGKPVAEYSDSNTFYALGVFSSKLLLFIFIKPIEIHISLSDNKFPKLVVLFQLSIPCASFLIIWSVSNSLYENNNNILFLIAIFALIAANIAVLYIFNAYLREYDRRNELLIVNQLINYQAQHFRDLASSNSTTRQTFHDLKNSLFAISSALKENEITSAISIINTLCHEVSNDFNLFATNNSAFNALLAAKYRSMTESKIQFKLKSFMLSHNAIENFDLCILLGNLLDNAIEACEKIKSNKKEITLHIIQAGDYLTIQVLNTIENKVQVIENYIETTKEDKNCHGFGLKSIKAIVEKYEGFYSIRQSNDTFSVIISIQNNLNCEYYNQICN